MGRNIKTRTRFLGKDGEWHYECRTCKEYKPESKMSTNKNKAFGIENLCKECKNEAAKHRNYEKYYIPKRKNPEFGTKWVETTNRTMSLKYVKDDDFEDTEDFLERIGYDLNEPIHIQFGKRIEEKYGVQLEFDDIPYQEKDYK